MSNLTLLNELYVFDAFSNFIDLFLCLPIQYYSYLKCFYVDCFCHALMRLREKKIDYLQLYYPRFITDNQFKGFLIWCRFDPRSKCMLR